MILYHITGTSDWDAQRERDVFTAPSLETEGFIHASTREQVSGTLARFFKGARELCIFSFDARRVDALRFDWVEAENQAFPHIYGAIPRSAITGCRRYATVEDALDGFLHPRSLKHRILELASVPSFSSYEEILHPRVLTLLQDVPDLTVRRIPHANLLIRRASRKGMPVVVLTAHLDKIDHFGGRSPVQLMAFEHNGALEGLLDDSAGLGTVISLFLDERLASVDLVLALSELEEGTGLRQHPERMRNGGAGLSHGQGARSLGALLTAEEPGLRGMVTIDTTPFFKGQPGVALYARHWELNGRTPSALLVERTEALARHLSSVDPDLRILNNTNDYLDYGAALIDAGLDVPCVALEPAIFPYHRPDERIFSADLERVYNLALAAVEWMARGGS